MIYIIEEKYNNKTLKEFLKSEVKPSRRLLTAVKKRQDGMTVNDTPVTLRYYLHTGDKFAFNYEDDIKNISEPPPEEGRYIKHPLSANSMLEKSITTVYEDEYILCVNKPANMPVHPSFNHFDDALSNAVAARSRNKVFRAANRLDKNTSGLVLIAKDKLVSARINYQMKHGEIRKTYDAILCGNPSVLTPEKIEEINAKLSEVNGRFEYDIQNQTGAIVAPIKRADDSIITRICAADGDFAETRFKSICTNGEVTYAEIYPKTGRTHQIRAHFKVAGFALLGDDLYFNNSLELSAKYSIHRHTLHAKMLEFTHPMTQKKIKAECEMPEDMRRIVRIINGEEKLIIAESDNSEDDEMIEEISEISDIVDVDISGEEIYEENINEEVE